MFNTIMIHATTATTTGAFIGVLITDRATDVASVTNLLFVRCVDIAINGAIVRIDRPIGVNVTIDGTLVRNLPFGINTTANIAAIAYIYVMSVHIS